MSTFYFFFSGLDSLFSPFRVLPAAFFPLFRLLTGEVPATAEANNSHLGLPFSFFPSLFQFVVSTAAFSVLRLSLFSSFRVMSAKNENESMISQKKKAAGNV